MLLGVYSSSASQHLCPDRFALCLGAVGICRAALSEALLPALLQCVQGPCDHYLWGELTDSYSPTPVTLQWYGMM